MRRLTLLAIMVCAISPAVADPGERVNSGFGEYSYVAFPVRVRFVSENLTTGALAADQATPKGFTDVWQLVGRHRDRPEDRWFRTAGLGLMLDGTRSFARSAERTAAPAGASRNVTGEGDELELDVTSVPLFFGIGRRVPFGSIAVTTGFWLTSLVRTDRDARWYGAETAPVVLVTRESRLFAPLFVAGSLDAPLFSIGRTRFGLIGRAGWIDPVRLGTDPNPGISALGVTPAAVGDQIQLGGFFWSAGITLSAAATSATTAAEAAPAPAPAP